MRQMPSVTETTVPTLRASLADENFSIRWRIRSLISEALIDMKLILPVVSLAGGRSCQLCQASADAAINDQVIGPDHGSADQGRIYLAVQMHVAVQAFAHGGGKALALLAVELGPPKSR